MFANMLVLTLLQSRKVVIITIIEYLVNVQNVRMNEFKAGTGYIVDINMYKYQMIKSKHKINFLALFCSMK